MDVTQLIQQELAHTDTQTLHPAIAPLPPLTQPQPQQQQTTTKTPSEGSSQNTAAIDMTRYDATTPESLALNTAYTLLQQASLGLAHEVNDTLWAGTNKCMKRAVDAMQDAVESRNHEIDDLGIKRRKVASEAEPTVRYLEQRREEALRKVVELRVAAIKLEMGSV